MSFRSRLSGRDLLTGPFLAVPSPMVVEMACAAAPDFICIDMEHGPIPPDVGENMVRAADVHGVPALVRVPGVDAATIGQALDWGATGILVPRVGSAGEARAVVAAARFPPEGKRGAGPGRASHYGRSIHAAVAAAREETVVAIQIETIEALDRLEEILAVSGIDLIVIGQGDLGLDLNAAGRDGDLSAGIDRVLSCCAKADGRAGTFAMTPDGLSPYRDRIVFGIVGSDTTVLVAGFDRNFPTHRP